MPTRKKRVLLRSVAPVFSTTDVARWLEHYRALGFEVEAHDTDYGFAALGPVELHVSRNPDHDPRSTAGCAYLEVGNADDVYRQWSAAPGGTDVEPVNTDTAYAKVDTSTRTATFSATDLASEHLQ